MKNMSLPIAVVAALVSAPQAASALTAPMKGARLGEIRGPALPNLPASLAAPGAARAGALKTSILSAARVGSAPLSLITSGNPSIRPEQRAAALDQVFLNSTGFEPVEALGQTVVVPVQPTLTMSVDAALASAPRFDQVGRGRHLLDYVRRNASLLSLDDMKRIRGGFFSLTADAKGKIARAYLGARIDSLTPREAIAVSKLAHDWHDSDGILSAYLLKNARKLSPDDAALLVEAAHDWPAKTDLALAYCASAKFLTATPAQAIRLARAAHDWEAQDAVLWAYASQKPNLGPDGLKSLERASTDLSSKDKIRKLARRP